MDSSMLPNCPVLVVHPSPVERDELNTILGHMGLQPQITPTYQTASELLRHQAFSLVMTDKNLPDGDWQLILEALDPLPQRPELVVFSRLADERLWYDVLQLGGFDVLSAPFNEAELSRVVALALNFWQRKHQGHSARVRVLRAAS